MKKDDLKLQNLKGTTDYLPDEKLTRNYIIGELKNIFELYGYLPLETSILCPYDLLSSKYAGGAEILKEVYTLYDQGQRKLGLRYDLTVPFSKVIAANQNLQLPFKRYEIGKVFRNGPVKLGRMREFYQCDIDACGIDGEYIEVELFQMAIDCYKKLGIDIVITWNNRKYLAGLLQECGIAIKNASKAIIILDKLEKFGRAEVEKELAEINVSKENANKIFEFLSKDFRELNYENLNDTLKQGIKEIIAVQTLIDQLGLKQCKFTPSLARGLEIYTGTVWEIFDQENRISSSLGGGGRYNKIITNFIDNGIEYPAVGMCFGLEPTYTLYNMMNEKKEIKKYDLQIFAFDLDANVLKIANQFRNQGIKTLVDYKNKKLKKSLEFANANAIPFIVILGADEIEQNLITIKNLVTGEQTTTIFKNVLGLIK